MADTAQFTIGTGVSCSDQPVGRVTQVIIDPVAEKVTHLVVEPEHRRDLARLVPLDLVDGTAGEIRLCCTRAQFERLEDALETRFMPATSGYDGYGYGRDQVGYWPYYGLGTWIGAGGGTPAEMVTTDTVSTAAAATYPPAAAGGPSVGPQGGSHPDRCRGQHRGRHPAQHRPATGAGPAAGEHRPPGPDLMRALRRWRTDS